MNNIKTEGKPQYVGIAIRNGKVGIISVQAETDFASRSEKFRQTVDSHALSLANSGDLESTIVNLTEDLEEFKEKVDISYDIFETSDNFVWYRYHDGNRLAFVEFEGPVDEKFAKPIAVQCVAGQPQCLDSSGVEGLEDMIAAEKQIALDSGKPEAIADKIAAGKISSKLKDIVLLEQSMYNNPSKTVKAYLADHSMVIKDYTLVT